MATVYEYLNFEKRGKYTIYFIHSPEIIILKLQLTLFALNCEKNEKKTKNIN